MNRFKLFSFLLMTLFTLACALHSHRPKQSKPEPFIPLSLKSRPGEVVHFTLGLPENFPGELHCRDKVIKAIFYEKGHQVFLAESYFSPQGSYQCRWNSKNRDFVAANIEVGPKEFPFERLYVDKKRVVLTPEDQVRIKRENEFKQKVYSNSPNSPLFKEAFAIPLNTKVTSIYGSKRIFNNKKQTQHLGTDYRAKVGTPIKAANAGKVVMARDFFYPGNTVVVDHGLGIFTVYGHLSRFKVAEGDFVSKGDIVGLSGKTGRVTGPHLHWGVIVNDLAVEGSTLVESTQKYFQKQ